MIHFIRILFLLLVSTVALVYTRKTSSDAIKSNTLLTYGIMVGSVVIAFAIITFDFLTRKKNLTLLSGLFFGLLVGILVSLGLGYMVDQMTAVLLADEVKLANQPLIEGCKLLLAIMTTYLAVSFILQTRDDYRFIIPYVEFTRATKGARPMLLD